MPGPPVEATLPPFKRAGAFFPWRWMVEVLTDNEIDLLVQAAAMPAAHILRSLNWTWQGSPTPPTLLKVEESVRGSIKSAIAMVPEDNTEPFWCSSETGGITVSCKRDVDEWCISTTVSFELAHSYKDMLPKQEQS
jgi:hypothetical protein